MALRRGVLLNQIPTAEYSPSPTRKIGEVGNLAKLNSMITIKSNKNVAKRAQFRIGLEEDEEIVLNETAINELSYKEQKKIRFLNFLSKQDKMFETLF